MNKAYKQSWNVFSDTPNNKNVKDINKKFVKSGKVKQTNKSFHEYDGTDALTGLFD